MDPVLPKFLLIGEGDQILGSCLDAEGVFGEAAERDEAATVEILGCLPSRRMRDYLDGSKRYRRRNPLDLAALRMLDVAGDPLADFWVGEIVDWRPSRLGDERVDVVVPWGDDGPLSDARHVWECWRTARPDGPDQWVGHGRADRAEWLTIVRHRSRWSTGRPGHPPGRTYDLDGTHVTDEAGFYLALGEAINGPGGYFGCNLDALADCLCGGFGTGVPFTLVWHHSRVARQSLTRLLKEGDEDTTCFEIIQMIFAERGVDVVLR
ncbi:barstar family protein [Streptosporangium sp. NPDC002524]|uniref:barstar family protein n=1 Tax=Streptosporangium sp. NPDC002524 TaxID=3154537 RepID=UPI0033333520